MKTLWNRFMAWCKKLVEREQNITLSEAEVKNKEAIGNVLERLELESALGGLSNESIKRIDAYLDQKHGTKEDVNQLYIYLQAQKDRNQKALENGGVGVLSRLPMTKEEYIQVCGDGTATENSDKMHQSMKKRLAKVEDNIRLVPLKTEQSNKVIASLKSAKPKKSKSKKAAKTRSKKSKK